MIRHRILSCILVIALVVTAATLGAEPEPEWTEWDLEERIAEVSDSELRLLGDGVPPNVHLHVNRMRIEPTSLDDGWVTLEQCHEHMDAVPRTQIAFRPERIRDLRITHAGHIGRAWVEGHTVQLEDIGPQARLCISAKSRALLNLGQGYYRLRTGPYMRRFLDGYYPMRVRIEVEYPSRILGFIRSHPATQAGIETVSEPGLFRIDAAFTGKLYSCLDFLRTGRTGDPEFPDTVCGSA